MIRAISVTSSYLVFAVLLLPAAAGAQPGAHFLSIDYFLTNTVTGERQHVILPVAAFDGTRFQPVREWDLVLGWSSRRPYLLTRYPIAQVVRHGQPIGAVTVSDISLRGFRCSTLVVGSGEYVGSAALPASEISGITRRRENGEQIEYATEMFLALSRAIDENPFDGEPVIDAVTDPKELQRYAMDVDRSAPRPELLPLGFNETRAYRFYGQNGVLVVRKRRTAGTIVGPGNSRIEGPLYTDIAIVREGPGQPEVFPLEGSGTRTDAFGKGPNDQFIDAFEHANGKVYLAFERQNYEVWHLRLYELGTAYDTKLVLETELYGC